uniref:Uncharacterized protein n=1 Tax=Anguilla anguilla TaxID=7936 RepID=A0A0E9PAY5_ANGAN
MPFSCIYNQKVFPMIIDISAFFR